MMNPHLRRVLTAVLPLITILFVHSSFAQRTAPSTSRAAGGAAGEEVIRLRKFEGLGSRTEVQTPEYEARSTLTRGIKPVSQWGRITLTYDSFPEWIDELTVQFYALAVITEKGQRKYSFYKLTVRYGDIEKGRSHTANAYLRPQAIKRFGALVAVAVEVSHEGRIIATESDNDASIPDEWWKKEAVTGSAGVTARSGYLLDRSKTPFALLNIDDHEVIR